MCGYSESGHVSGEGNTIASSYFKARKLKARHKESLLSLTYWQPQDVNMYYLLALLGSFHQCPEDSGSHSQPITPAPWPQVFSGTGETGIQVSRLEPLVSAHTTLLISFLANISI